MCLNTDIGQAEILAVFEIEDKANRILFRISDTGCKPLCKRVLFRKQSLLLLRRPCAQVDCGGRSRS